MKRKYLSAAIVILLLTASAGVIQAQENSSRPPLISVTGTAEISLPPDEVVLSLGIESHDRVLADAKAQNDSRGKKVLALAQAAGVDPKDIQTSAVTMGPDYSEEKIPKLLGYDVSQSITITLRDVSKYESLMTKLIEAGINRVNGIRFQIAQPRKFEDEARTKAVLAAKEKAVAMAEALGRKVGVPWEISEQNAAYPNYIQYSNVQANDDLRRFSEESSVAPGQVTIRVSVAVSFVLQ